MWKVDYKEGWVPQRINAFKLVLEKTLESPLDYKEIQPVHPKGHQSWVFIGRTDAEVETPILWSPDVKSWLIGEDPDAGKHWRLEEKGTTEDEVVAARLLCPWGFSRQEYWNGLPCPPPGVLPNPGTEPRSPALQADSSSCDPPGKPKNTGVGTQSCSLGSSQPRSQTRVSFVAGRFFTNWATREALISYTPIQNLKVFLKITNKGGLQTHMGTCSV